MVLKVVDVVKVVNTSFKDSCHLTKNIYIDIVRLTTPGYVLSLTAVLFIPQTFSHPPWVHVHQSPVSMVTYNPDQVLHEWKTRKM